MESMSRKHFIPRIVGGTDYEADASGACETECAGGIVFTKSVKEFLDLSPSETPFYIETCHEGDQMYKIKWIVDSESFVTKFDNQEDANAAVDFLNENRDVFSYQDHPFRIGVYLHEALMDGHFNLPSQ